MNNSTFHILVVDDDDRIRELVKQYLEEIILWLLQLLTLLMQKKN